MSFAVGPSSEAEDAPIEWPTSFEVGTINGVGLAGLEAGLRRRPLDADHSTVDCTTVLCTWGATREQSVVLLLTPLLQSSPVQSVC